MTVIDEAPIVRKHKPYTPEEDRMIYEASAGEVAEVARKIGRRYRTVVDRHKKLHCNEIPYHHDYSKPRIRDKSINVDITSRFARPSFFDEDITKLALVGAGNLQVKCHSRKLG